MSACGHYTTHPSGVCNVCKCADLRREREHDAYVPKVDGEPTSEPCPYCKRGKNHAVYGQVPCPDCRGTGTLLRCGQIRDGKRCDQPIEMAELGMCFDCDEARRVGVE